MSEQPFFVPDYYKNFHCKGGACRHSCCGDWNIAISMEEYFRLLGMECTPELRRRLDSALYQADDRDEEHYANICPNYVGDCPMHREDGLCGLQWEGGEEVLPDVCRQFPRSVTVFGRPICVCSSACEHTVELLTADDAPVTVEEALLPSYLLCHGRAVEHTPEREATARACIRIAEDRSMPLSRRIDRIAAYLHGESMDRAADSLSQDTVFLIQQALARHYAEHSRAAGAYCRVALDTLPCAADFVRGLDALERRFPSLWIWMEKLLVNYMLQECFPYTGRDRELKDEGLALCAVYAFCLFLLVGNPVPDREAFIDLAASAFRLIAHTAFDHNALVIIRRNIPSLFDGAH